MACKLADGPKLARGSAKNLICGSIERTCVRQLEAEQESLPGSFQASVFEKENEIRTESLNLRYIGHKNDIVLFVISAKGMGAPLKANLPIAIARYRLVAYPKHRITP